MLITVAPGRGGGAHPGLTPRPHPGTRRLRVRPHPRARCYVCPWIRSSLSLIYVADLLCSYPGEVNLFCCYSVASLSRYTLLRACAACRARAPVKFFSHLPARCPYVLSFILLSLTHSASTLSLLRYLATRTQTSFKHRKLSTRFELLVPYLLLPHTRQSNLRSLNTSSIGQSPAPPSPCVCVHGVQVL